MEKGILKIICASQGAVDTDFLECNLGSSVSEIISSSDKFVFCCPFGQQKVVARTKVQLCQTKGCLGSCRRLHVCKGFLLSGSCQPMLTSGGCSFSHELNSEHNRRILGEHELGDLSREELCTLLMQSDDQMLPPICHDYNNGPGLFGRCQGGYGCRRVHICERFLNHDCRCSRNHTFRAPHTLKVLHDIPEHLIHSLRSTYANIQAVKYHKGRLRSDRLHGDNPEQSF
ncbi:protein mono-ADP-ribosyltransferase PARP12-like isoform X2 [Takifugu rubripes]|uniref:protein mono-ADP-ribosyltransferase PARP12-like isoform X2 n=1 Tax=Takifugu rubripes TaxID=31033 RepID=UPI001145EF34|nr:protein mono-ADP-ribosyltransferase PARP12-like isoform X2 [Takifugu rubripes]